MKLRFIVLESKAPSWVNEARIEYVQKIHPYVRMELQSLKSPAGDREQADVKRRKEGELILKAVDERELLVLFDERGKLPKSSEDFAEHLRRVLESGKQSVALCIGGAYGFSADVHSRADLKWSLSALTMNHWMAQLVALEQVYRGLTILKGIPYHNR